MVDSSILYRVGSGKRILEDENKYDVFISAYNLSARVTHTFNRISSSKKFWIIHKEYNFSRDELPTNASILQSSASQEAEYILEVLSAIEPKLEAGIKLCVDITGFMRPHLLFLIRYLKEIKIIRFDLVYTEPSHYSTRADTIFSSNVVEVRQINGFEGTHLVDTTNDLLVVGAGYDHDLISYVMALKSGARLVQLLSLPSLSADMYQESLIRQQRIADMPNRLPDDQQAYASANDPYSTYVVLEETIRRMRERLTKPGNIYLSPLATKPQAVGFAMYYLDYLDGQEASIIFPFASSYSKETSSGVGRAWIYEMDLSDRVG